MDNHDGFAVCVNRTSLLSALSNMLNIAAADAVYETERLCDGTVGDVVRVRGDVSAGGTYPFDLVVKTQRQWERHGDPQCWRREYDIYKHNIVAELPPHIRLPRAYLLEEEDGLTRIWMEYVSGATGNERLHDGELAYAAGRLGRFQAEFSLNGRADIGCLRPFPAVRSSFDLWWGRMAAPLAVPIDGFPEALRHALNGYATRAPAVLGAFDALPLTLCQGDVHHDNIILREGPDGPAVYIIDWDCAGYGRMGEDAVDVLLEAFVYSSRAVALLPSYRRRIVEAYCEGASAGGVDFRMSGALVRDIFAMAWGFRVADLYLYYKEDEAARNRCVDILEAMLE